LQIVGSNVDRLPKNQRGASECANRRRLGTPPMVVDGDSIADWREAGWSWPTIAKAMGCGVGSAYLANRCLSKNPMPETLSRNPLSEEAAAD